MADIGDTALTLGDWAKRKDPDGATAAVAEVLSERNEILQDMHWIEGNLPTGHRSTQRTTLPSGTWRLLNQGVANEKSTTVQVTDTVGMLETYAEVDKSLADLNGNTNEFRASEDRAFIEGMGQEAAQTIFYGDTATNPEEFMGFMQRFNSTSSNNGGQVLLADSGASGSDQTSVYLINWGENRVHGIFPKGSKAGLTVEDKGQVTLLDGSNNQYEGYRTHYKWDMGIAVRDWRYVVRIANIDTSALVLDAATGSNLPDVMVQALETIEDPSGAMFYCNRTVRSFLRRHILNNSQMNLVFDTVAGKEVMTFGGAPVRLCDQLTITEAVIT